MLTKDHARRFWSVLILSRHCPAMVQHMLMTKQIFGVSGWSTDKNKQTKANKEKPSSSTLWVDWVTCVKGIQI